MGISPASVTTQLDESLSKLPRVTTSHNVSFSNDTAEIFQTANDFADQLHDAYVSTEQLLRAIFAANGEASKILKAVGVTEQTLAEGIMAVRGSQQVDTANPEGKFDALAKYTHDLTDAAARGKLDPVIGRDDEIRRALQVLSRRSKNKPVLIGGTGVGQTAIAEGIAQRIYAKDVPEPLSARRVFSQALGDLVAVSQ